MRIATLIFRAVNTDKKIYRWVYRYKYFAGYFFDKELC